MKQSQIIAIDSKPIKKLQAVIATYYYSNKWFRFTKQEISIMNNDDSSEQHITKLNIIADLCRLRDQIKEQIKDSNLQIKLVLPQRQHIYLFIVIAPQYYLAKINTQQYTTELTIFANLVPVEPSPILQGLMRSKIINYKFFQKLQRGGQSSNAYLFASNQQNGDKMLIEGKQEEKNLVFSQIMLSKGQVPKDQQIKTIIFLERELVYVFNNAEMKIYNSLAPKLDNYEYYLQLKRAIQNQIRKLHQSQNKFELLNVISSPPYFYFLFILPQSKNRYILIQQTRANDFSKATQQKYYVPNPTQSQQQVSIRILSQTKNSTDLILSQGTKHYLVQLSDSGRVRTIPISSDQKIQFGINNNKLIWLSSFHCHTSNAFLAQNKVLQLQSRPSLKQSNPILQSSRKMLSGPMTEPNNRLKNQLKVTDCHSDQQGENKQQKPSSQITPPTAQTVNQPQSLLSFGVKPPLPQAPQSFMSFGVQPNKFDQADTQFEIPSLGRNISFGSSKQVTVRTRMVAAASRTKLLQISRKIKRFHGFMGNALSECLVVEKEAAKMSAKNELLEMGRTKQMREYSLKLIKKSRLNIIKQITKDDNKLTLSSEEILLVGLKRQYDAIEAVTNYYLQLFQTNKKSIKSKQVLCCENRIQSNIERQIILLKSKVYNNKQQVLHFQGKFKSTVNIAKKRQQQLKLGKDEGEGEGEYKVRMIRQRLKKHFCW